MQPERSLAIMKALADQSRLAIVNSLLDRSQYVEEIAQRHALAPSTVSFHLKKLEKAGLVSSRKEQYYVVFEANRPVFDTTLREIISASPVKKELQEMRIDDYRRKVLESFFRNGVLEKLPAQHKKRLIVLEQFALRFEPGHRYSETEVTGLIKPLFEDYCTVRRLLVDERLVLREGALYWREAEAGVPASLPVSLPPPALAGAAVTPRDQRAEIKRLYKQNRPDMGVYQIRNLANGKLYIDSSKNLEGTRTSRLFQIRMGKIVFNPELQKDVTQFGAGSFEFSVLEVLPELEEQAAGRELMAAKLRWQAKLQPFGERGYNSTKGYLREKDQIGLTLPDL